MGCRMVVRLKTPRDTHHRIEVVRLSADESPRFWVELFGNAFQNRIVSSPAPVTIVSPCKSAIDGGSVRP